MPANARFEELRLLDLLGASGLYPWHNVAEQNYIPLPRAMSSS